MNFSLPADVRLVFEGSKSLPAHSQVLSLASPVLREALSLAKPGADGVKELPLPGDNRKHWKLLLDVLYDGMIGKGHDSKVTSSNALALAVLADKYDMASLRRAVDRFMRANWKNLNLDGKLEWLGIASRLKSATKALLDGVCKEAMRKRSSSSSSSSSSSPLNNHYGVFAPPEKQPRANDKVLCAVAQMAPSDARKLLVKLLGYRVE